jgi:hypothetical protein
LEKRREKYREIDSNSEFQRRSGEGESKNTTPLDPANTGIGGDIKNYKN